MPIGSFVLLQYSILPYMVIVCDFIALYRNGKLLLLVDASTDITFMSSYV